MKREFNKKRFWLIVGLIAVCEVFAVYLVTQWKYLFPKYEVSEVYTRYAGTPGVDASFVKDYRVNDSVFVDATLLEATTDSGWAQLLQDFNLELPTQEMLTLLGADFVEVWSAPKRDYSLPMDSVILNNDLLTVSWVECKICVFSIEDEQQLVLLRRKQLIDNM